VLRIRTRLWFNWLDKHAGDARFDRLYLVTVVTLVLHLQVLGRTILMVGAIDVFLDGRL
jgi:hypothetical protein